MYYLHVGINGMCTPDTYGGQKKDRIPWNWNYIWPARGCWVLKAEPRPSVRILGVLFPTEPSLLPLLSTF